MQPVELLGLKKIFDHTPLGHKLMVRDRKQMFIVEDVVLAEGATYREMCGVRISDKETIEPEPRVGNYWYVQMVGSELIFAPQEDESDDL